MSADAPVAEQDRRVMVISWQELVVRQQGLVTRAQAQSFGVGPATVSRRISGPRPSWQRVHRRVYATFLQPLTPRQHTMAAWLYAGSEAVVSGAAALHWHGVSYLPREVLVLPVDVLVPAGRECVATDLVRVQRIRHPARTSTIDHLVCATVARAAADCARRLPSYEAVLSMASSALNSRQATLEQLMTELGDGPVRGSRQLRRVIAAAASNARSVPEAAILDLIRSTGLPEPLVNQPLVVNGRTWVPDIRWGRLILEIDSKEWHLLHPGSWEATQQRRLALQAAGYHVVPITPAQIRDRSKDVLAAILAAYVTHVAA